MRSVLHCVSLQGPVSPTTSPGRRKVHFVDDSVGRVPPCIDTSPGDVTPHPPLVVDIHYRDKQKQATPIPTTTITATPVTTPPVPTTGLVESHTADTEISLTTSSVKELANFMGRYLDAHFPKKRVNIVFIKTNTTDYCYSYIKEYTKYCNYRKK